MAGNSSVESILHKHTSWSYKAILILLLLALVLFVLKSPLSAVQFSTTGITIVYNFIR